jgi:hypothetical protein
MKLSSLLAQRQALLRQARLANLAFAYDRLSDFARRIARTRLAGEVRLQQAAPDAERFWTTLTALQGNQSVIEEHFSDEDLMDLADVIAYATGDDDFDMTFRIEELADRFLAPLREQLTQSGVALDHDERAVEQASPESPTDCSHADESS